MERCKKRSPKNCCVDSHFQCISHKKCKKENDHECRCDVQLVKDCICCEWSVPEGESQTVFQTGGFEQIFGSGFISYDCGEGAFVTVQFFLNGMQVGSDINVFRDSCVTFSFTRFDRIVVTCQAAPAVATGNNDECPDACEGEICITTRYPVC